MAQRRGSVGRIALFALIGAIVAIPVPFIGPILGAIAGGLIGFIYPGKYTERTGRSGGNGLQTFGIMAVVIGLFLVLYSLMMDTTVATGEGRVNNIGLMRDQQNLLFISGILFLAGIVMIVVSRNNQSKLTDPFDDSGAARVLERKRYAVSIGIVRVNGKYEWGGHKFTDLDDAIEYVETQKALLANEVN